MRHSPTPETECADGGYEDDSQGRLSGFLGSFRKKLGIALIGLFSLAGSCAVTSTVTVPHKPKDPIVRKNKPASDTKEKRPAGRQREKLPKNNPAPASDKERYEDAPWSLERCLWWDRCFITDSRDSFRNDKS